MICSITIIFSNQINRSLDINSVLHIVLVTPPYYGNQAVGIGLSETRQKGIYEWSDGSPVDYTNWDPFEPNNYPGASEDCVNLYLGVSTF